MQNMWYNRESETGLATAVPNDDFDNNSVTGLYNGHGGQSDQSSSSSSLPPPPLLQPKPAITTTTPDDDISSNSTREVVLTAPRKQQMDHRGSLLTISNVFQHDLDKSESVEPSDIPSSSHHQPNNTVPSNLFRSNPTLQSLSQNFAMEHRIFLRAILSLLNERDQFALEDINDPHTIKTGPLKKATVLRGVWKTKYVEIRRGIFSYWEDETGLRRKSLPLRASVCTCRAVKMQSNPFKDGAIFELTVEGGPKRLWMANSREERQAWIHAIHEAMIGSSVTYGNQFLEYHGDGIPMHSPYRRDLEAYIDVQKRLKGDATDRETYLTVLQVLIGTSISVPVQWIKERVEVEGGEDGRGGQQFEEGSVSTGIAQLWKDMLRDSVEINDVLFKGDSGHGPERIIGALTRFIKDFDKTARPNKHRHRHHTSQKSKISDLQAVSFARDVLLACNRTRSGGDSYYCVDNLCNHPDLVVLCPFSSEAAPLKIEVRHATSENSQDLTTMRRPSIDRGANDRSGWIKTRGTGKKQWKKLFCVLSEGVLSYYEKDQPRPHGLRGQLNLRGATMGVVELDDSDVSIICIVSKDRAKERQLCLEDRTQFIVWNEALQQAIDQSEKQSAQLPVSEILEGKQQQPTANSSSSTPLELSSTIKQHLSRAPKILKGKLSPPLQVLRTSKQTVKTEESEPDTDDAIPKPSENAVTTTSTTKDCNETSTTTPSHPEAEVTQELRRKNASTPKSHRSKSTVQIHVQASTVYKICTTDPEGDERDDTWATLRTKFLQSFRLSGGPRGRMIRGEEVVQMDFLEGLAELGEFEKVFGSTMESNDDE